MSRDQRLLLEEHNRLVDANERLEYAVKSLRDDFELVDRLFSKSLQHELTPEDFVRINCARQRQRDLRQTMVEAWGLI